MPPATETTGLDIATFVVALIALIASLTLASIRIWEVALRRSRWDLKFDWIHGRRPERLRFTVANIGTRTYGIREIRFGTSDTPKDAGWMPQAAVLDKLPLLIEEGEISDAFYIQVPAKPTHDFDRHLGGLSETSSETLAEGDERGLCGLALRPREVSAPVALAFSLDPVLNCGSGRTCFEHGRQSCRRRQKLRVDNAVLGACGAVQGGPQDPDVARHVCERVQAATVNGYAASGKARARASAEASCARQVRSA